MKIYFHGTEKKNLTNILNEGLKTKYGWATFTQNPVYTLSFSSSRTWGTKKKIEDYSTIIRGGMMLVFKIPKSLMKVAVESDLVMKPKNKIITGWPNRFKTEQYGFFPSKNKGGNRIVVPSRYIVAAYSYNQNFIETMQNISRGIISGKMNKKLAKKKLEKLFSDKSLFLLKPKISNSSIARLTLEGMVRNIVLREIRTLYLSKMNLAGWKIENYGNHPVKLRAEADIDKSIRNLIKIIRENPIAPDIKEEFKELQAF